MELYIGENIKRLRKEKGITQETLADHMHISTAAVSKWERNETLPDISMVIPLASYFGDQPMKFSVLIKQKMKKRFKCISKKVSILPQ